MAFSYSASVREAACRRMLAGERVEEVAGDLEMSVATLFRWRRQALIDAGRKPGVKSFEPDGPTDQPLRRSPPRLGSPDQWVEQQTGYGSPAALCATATVQ